MHAYYVGNFQSFILSIALNMLKQCNYHMVTIHQTFKDLISNRLLTSSLI